MTAQIKRVCLWCKRGFEKGRDKYGHTPKTLFCSNSCSKKHWWSTHEGKMLRQELSSHYLQKRIEKLENTAHSLSVKRCALCNTEFKPKIYTDGRVSKARFCSLFCSNKEKTNRTDVREKMRKHSLRWQNEPDNKAHMRAVQKVTQNRADVLLKKYMTKKQNNSFHLSNKESIIYQELCAKFGAGNVSRQYRDGSRYPFACDFYIKPLDMFIEYNGTWTHGKEPYDADNLKHQKTLLLWREKAKTSQFYVNAIEVWTVSDPFKVATANKNGINLLVFYTEKETMDWRNKQPGGSK